MNVAYVKSMLDTDEGISENQYAQLVSIMRIHMPEKTVDAILNRVDATDGRFYVKEGSLDHLI